MISLNLSFQIFPQPPKPALSHFPCRPHTQTLQSTHPPRGSGLINPQGLRHETRSFVGRFTYAGLKMWCGPWGRGLLWALNGGVIPGMSPDTTSVGKNPSTPSGNFLIITSHVHHFPHHSYATEDSKSSLKVYLDASHVLENSRHYFTFVLAYKQLRLLLFHTFRT